VSDQKLYEVALSLIPGIGTVTSRLLISYTGSAKAALQTPKGKLLRIPGIGPALADAVAGNCAQALKEAEDIIQKADKVGARILFYLDKEYPYRLKQIADAPTLIYYQGTSDLNASRILSIVGTRKSTQYGKDVTDQFLSDLALYEPLIISGLAYGIDIAAHRAALKNNLSTIGVMASGLDIIYPSAHQKTAEHMKLQGGLLSEYPFGTKPDAPRFPARNRIVAGLADATLVIEATEKGGALISADLANDYDRDVFAVPGPIHAVSSAGCNELIKTNRAALCTCAADIVKALNWSLLKEQVPVKAVLDLEMLSEEEQSIMKLLLAAEDEHIDTLSWKTQLPISKVASLLLQLEFQGLVRSLPGKKFALQRKK